MAEVTSLYTDRKVLEITRVATAPLPELKPGEALLKIRRLAVTTNNITYAAFGDTPHLRYWDFFPTGEDGWGQMPAWGFAEVVESTVAGVEPGERFYGFWPVATHLVMQPVRVSQRGFYDGKAHRLELTSAYNQYQRVETDAAYRAEDENYQMLLRPLFITSFMLADFLEDNHFFGGASDPYFQWLQQDRIRHGVRLEGRQGHRRHWTHLRRQPRFRRQPGLLHQQSRLW